MSIFVDNVAYRPFQYPWAVEVEKKHRIAMHWHEDQVELADDLRQWNSKGGLETENVPDKHNRNLVEKLIMLFTEMDVQVGAGYAKMLPYVKNNEIRTMMMTFAAREITHQRGYALAAETFGFTNSDWSQFKSYKEMQDKIDLITEDIGDLSDPLQFAKQLSTVFLGEGIALFGAFACLLNLRRFALMQNFNVVNEWSLKDEQEHVTNNMKVLLEVRKDLTNDQNKELDQYIEKVITKYVEAEKTFIDLVFEMGPQEDMTKEQARSFIDYLGQLRRFEIGLVNEQDIPENPIPWIDYLLTANTHTAFFESRSGFYSHNKLAGEVNYDKYKSMIL